MEERGEKREKLKEKRKGRSKLKIATVVEFSKALELVIDDLQTVRTRYPVELPIEATDVVATYLLANRGFIENRLESAYSVLNEETWGLTEEERGVLRENHDELFDQGVDDSWGELAVHVITHHATWHWAQQIPMKEDNISVLVKGLDYAKYCTFENIRVRLFLHPIDQYLP
jgi:hypothetical protein